MRERLMAWWMQLMVWAGFRKAANQVTARTETVHLDPEPKGSRAPRRKAALEIASLGELLATMDETFKNYSLPFSKYSWIERSEATGLRKMGIHIPHPYADALLDGPLTTKDLPALFCVALGWSILDDDERMYPAAIFGIKLAKLPISVDYKAGIHYKFGMGFKLGISSYNDKNQELYWIAGYATVLSNGNVHIHDERRTERHVIRVKSSAHRKAVGSTFTIHTKQWSPATIARMRVNKDDSLPAILENTKKAFISALIWWQGREDRWNVIVKKAGERVTFGIPKELTKNVFCDRIKVKTPNGATKPIFHYVRPHTRANGSEVKEHVRGLDKFSWNNYQCQITAPKLTSTTSAFFTLACEEREDTDDMTGLLDISKVGTLLARVEEVRCPA